MTDLGTDYDESYTEFEKEFYGKALKEAEVGPASTGYGNPVNQFVRFKEVMFSLGKMCLDDQADFGDVEQGEDEFDQPFSILDVGCGTGDLLGFFTDAGVQISRYVGVDRDPRMIEVAEKRFKSVGVDATWRTGDVVDNRDDFDGDPFDLATSIATYALKPKDWDQSRTVRYLQDQITCLVALSTKMTFVTMFSTWKNNVLPTEMNVDPAVMFNWAMTEFGRVDMSHAYAPHDFSLSIYPGLGAWRKAHE